MRGNFMTHPKAHRRISTAMLAAFAGTLLLSGSKAEDERLVIDDQGRVGVNEPAPQRRLHIKDVGGGMVRLTKTGVVAREWDINVTTNGSFAIGDNSAQADRVHIDVNGRVGVNETAPGKRLQITDAGGEMIRMKKTVGVPREWDINVTTNGSFALGDNTSGGDRLVIDTNGNISIGGGSPSFKRGHLLAYWGASASSRPLSLQSFARWSA